MSAADWQEVAIGLGVVVVLLAWIAASVAKELRRVLADLERLREKESRR